MWGLLRRCLGLLLQSTCKPGSLPQHVAFIMDGNRRFASLQHIGKLDGHSLGYSKMVDVIHWCLEMGIKYISVYAFSIDNFQRSHEEVAALMQLAENKYRELAQEDGLAERKGVRMHILGDLDLAPASVRGAAARLMQVTAALRNKQAVLNICFAYTSTEETVHAVDLLQHAQQAGCITAADVTPELLELCLRTQGCPLVDLLVRTSGETRLSDFMVWQAAHAHLAFVDKLWPDFTFPDFLGCILEYAGHAPALQQLRCCAHAGRQHPARPGPDPCSMPAASPQAPSPAAVGAVGHPPPLPPAAHQWALSMLLVALAWLSRCMQAVLTLAWAASVSMPTWAARALLAASLHAAQSATRCSGLNVHGLQADTAGLREPPKPPHRPTLPARLRALLPGSCAPPPAPIQMCALTPAPVPRTWAPPPGSATSGGGCVARRGSGRAGILRSSSLEQEQQQQQQQQHVLSEEKGIKLGERQGLQGGGGGEHAAHLEPLQLLYPCQNGSDESWCLGTQQQQQQQQQQQACIQGLGSHEGRGYLITCAQQAHGTATGAEVATGCAHLPLHVQHLLQLQCRQHQAWLEAHAHWT